MREGTAVAGRYRLLERIGAGGMGEVWRATDETLNRTVAVKVVLPSAHADPEFRRRFLAEARAMASVHHPNVVAIHDFGETRDPDAGWHHDPDAGQHHASEAGQHQGAGPVAYLVMEYVAGETLSQVLRRTGRLSPAHTMYLVSQTAQALQAVHNHGIVHRDIKPANLMIRADGSVALTDFGIALGADTTALTQPGTVLGTPSYLAPEQVLGQPATARSDVYALGLVAYECLAGQKPFVADDPFGAALKRVHVAAPPLPPDVPPQVAGVVSRALAADPARRWQTAAELALAAGRVTGDAGWTGGGQPVAGHAVPAAPGRGRRQRAYGLAAAVVVLLVVGAVALWPTLRAALSDAQSRTAQGDGRSADQRGGGRSAPQLPTGFVACGEALCPVAPMCWRGLVQQGDRAYPPGSEDCAMPHYWETFAATYLPGDAHSDRDSSRLMERTDVAGICSAEMMAQRSGDPARTDGWRREAWPIPAGPSMILVHCLAGSPDGESRGAAFGSA